MQSLEFQRFGIHEDRQGVRTVTSSLHVDSQTQDKEKYWEFWEFLKPQSSNLVAHLLIFSSFINNKPSIQMYEPMWNLMSLA